MNERGVEVRVCQVALLGTATRGFIVTVPMRYRVMAGGLVGEEAAGTTGKGGVQVTEVGTGARTSDSLGWKKAARASIGHTERGRGAGAREHRRR